MRCRFSFLIDCLLGRSLVRYPQHLVLRNRGTRICSLLISCCQGPGTKRTSGISTSYSGINRGSIRGGSFLRTAAGGGHVDRYSGDRLTTNRGRPRLHGGLPRRPRGFNKSVAGFTDGTYGDGRNSHRGRDGAHRFAPTWNSGAWPLEFCAELWHIARGGDTWTSTD